MNVPDSLSAVTGLADSPGMAGFFNRIFPDPEERRAVLLWLTRRDSPHTRRAYFSDAVLFIWFLNEDMGKSRLREAVYSDIEAFRAKLMSFCAASGQSVNSVRRRIASVKSLYSYLLKSGVMERNPAAGVDPPRAVDTLNERILSEEEARAMIDSEENGRNRALLKFLYSTGIRVSEVVAVRWGDISFAAGKKPTVTVLGKGSKTRTITFSEETLKTLFPLRKNPSDRSEPVFRSGRGGTLDPSQVFRIVRKAAKKAGIDRPVSPHWMRHAHATHALSRGAPVHLVKWQLGHSSAEMTMRYTHVMPQEGSSDYLDDF